MAFLTSQFWYCNSGDGSTTGHYATATWTALTAYVVGNRVRQLAAPAVGSERIFICTIAGTSLAAEPTWTITQGAKTAEASGPTWVEVTGKSALNGDLTHTPNWTTVKNTAVSQGVIIQRNNGVSYQICTTAGTAGNGAEPSFSDTAGTTTSDNTVTWTSLGAVGNYAAWSTPWARISLVKAASPFSAAGDTVYVSNNHAETQATAITYATVVATNALQVKIYCVSDAASPPTSLATTASISTTGANSISITGGNEYWYGLNFNCGSAANTASFNVTSNGTPADVWIMESCTFKLNNTSTSSNINPGGVGGSGSDYFYPKYLNSTFIFGNASQGLSGGFNQQYTMVGCIIAGSGTAPSNLIRPATNGARPNYIYIIDTDLSGITGTLATVTNHGGGDIYLQNCKLGAAVAITSGSYPGTSGKVTLVDCDSTNTNYRYYDACLQAVTQQETTIVRSGSLATDGTTPISWACVTGSTVGYWSPYTSREIGIWNDVVGSTVTATFYLISSTTLNNNDFWIDVEYLGTSGFPLGVFTTSKMPLLGTATALTSDTSTWGGSTNKYKVVLTFIPQVKGPIKARGNVAKASATTYIDPYIYLS